MEWQTVSLTLKGLHRTERHNSEGEGMVYDLKMAEYIDAHGIDRQALLDGYPIEKEPEKQRKEAVKKRSGRYRQRGDLSNNELDEIVEMYRRGAKIKHIAAKFELRDEAVNKTLNSANVARRRKPTVRVDRAKAIEMLLNGTSAKKVATTLNCALNTVRDYQRELKDLGRL